MCESQGTSIDEDGAKLFDGLPFHLLLHPLSFFLSVPLNLLKISIKRVKETAENKDSSVHR